LKNGVDYTGSINRMRFDMVVNAVYLAVASAVSALLADAGVDAHNIDEIIYVDGTTCLPGLDDCICLNGEFREEIETPFHVGRLWKETLVIPQRFWLLDVLSKAEAFSREVKMNEVKATTLTLEVLFPNNLREGKEVTERTLVTVYSEGSGPPCS
jgi:heat shock 70kDa protein 1/2/6/8